MLLLISSQVVCPTPTVSPVIIQFVQQSLSCAGSARSLGQPVFPQAIRA